MKRKYFKPSMGIEMFEASEYIAACYRMQCNVDNKNKFVGGVAYNETNGKQGYQSSDHIISTGRGCGATYTVKTQGELLPNAMWHKGSRYDNDKTDSAHDTHIYYHRTKWNIHFTKAGTWTRDTVNAS